MDKQEGRPFDKCFIDADSLIYRIALKGVSLETAKKYYDEEIEKSQKELSEIENILNTLNIN